MPTEVMVTLEVSEVDVSELLAKGEPFESARG